MGHTCSRIPAYATACALSEADYDQRDRVIQRVPDSALALANLLENLLGDACAEANYRVFGQNMT